MKLADYIAEFATHRADVFRFGSTMSAAIDRAQRFDISDDVMSATMQLLQSRPSSLLSALPLCKMPYRTMWIEWRGGLMNFNHERLARDPKNVQIPTREGMLIEEITPRVGCISYAWAHNKKKFPDTADDELYSDIKHIVNVCPIGIYFDFDGTDDLSKRIDFVHTRMCYGLGVPYLKDLLDSWMHSHQALDQAGASSFLATANIKAWHRLAHDEKEIDALCALEKTAKIGMAPHGFLQAKAVFQKGTPQEVLQHVRNWQDDIIGGAAIVRGILALMNTKNILTNEPEDMSRLNKARGKSGKRPLLPFTTTKLTMSRARANAAGAAGLTREQARLHLVRGHFKVRKGGVFWWSSFPRGDRARPLERREYEVTK